MYSYHIFLFPFRWNYNSGDSKSSELPFSKRTKIEKFNDLKNPKWKASSYHLNYPVEFYNDATFFYDSIRLSVFNIQTPLSEKSKALGIVQNYDYDFGESTVQYIITTKDFGDFKLRLNAARLNVYQSGVGVLSFHLSNEKYKNREDILKINDFGRRFFPQFLDTVNENLLDGPQRIVLPLKIEIVSESDESDLKNRKEYLKEDFEGFKKVNDKSTIQVLIERQPERLPNGSEKLIQAFLGEKFHLEAFEKKEEEGITLKPTLDDRLFGICWFGDKDSSKQLKYNVRTKRYGFEDYKVSEYWMRFLFMEKGESSCRSRLMRSHLMLNHTYHRWADYGTLYGSTRSTFVSLSDASDDSKKLVLGPMRRSYFEMVQLVLVQHASIQRFSDEVTLLRAKEEQERNADFFPEARYFYRKYLEFVDRLYFQDVSPLEQANELYHLQQVHLGIEPNLRKLEMEMAEFSNLINRLEQDRREEHNKKLSLLATLVLPASLIAAIFGMSTLGDDFDFFGSNWHPKFWISLLFVIFFSILLVIAGNWYLNRKSAVSNNDH